MKSNMYKISQVILLSVLLVACYTTKNQNATKSVETKEQVFIQSPPSGASGKCYAKFKKGYDLVWTECLCENQISKALIHQVQSDLMRLNYEIDVKEINENIIGDTTGQAINDFQKKNNMAYGGLDWATVNRLKSE